MWVPDSCSFDLWDAQKFCTALGNRTVLIVGDSTLQQVAVTLINMIISNSGNCADRITFAKSYFLTFKKWGERKKNIFEFVEDINPDIVVFSAGAHLHDLGDLYSVMVQYIYTRNIFNKSLSYLYVPEFYACMLACMLNMERRSIITIYILIHK